MPERFLLIDEGAVAIVTCEALSFPPSVITWTRAFADLPHERSTVYNGTLRIQDFSMSDSGTYSCTARNKLGSVTAVTTLGFQRKSGNYKAFALLYFLFKYCNNAQQSILFRASFKRKRTCEGIKVSGSKGVGKGWVAARVAKPSPFPYPLAPSVLRWRSFPCVSFSAFKNQIKIEEKRGLWTV